MPYGEEDFGGRPIERPRYGGHYAHRKENYHHKPPARNLHYYADDAYSTSGSIIGGEERMSRVMLASLTSRLADLDGENARELAELVVRMRRARTPDHQVAKELGTFVGRTNAHRILQWLGEEERRLGIHNHHPSPRDSSHCRDYSPRDYDRPDNRDQPDNIVVDARTIIEERRKSRRDSVVSVASSCQSGGGSAEPCVGLAGLGPEDLMAPPPAILGGSMVVVDLLSTKSSKRKCPYFPHCTDRHCPHVHPSAICRFFPNCARGDACLYVHPVLPCRFQSKCTNPTCNYQHHSPAVIGEAATTSTPTTATIATAPTMMCKFVGRPGGCQNAQCPFLHGASHNNHAPRHYKFINVQCRFGRRCARQDCPYIHPESAKDSHLDATSEDAESASTLSALSTQTVVMKE